VTRTRKRLDKAGVRHGVAGSSADPQTAAGRYGPTTRRPVGDVVHLDRYGTPFA